MIPEVCLEKLTKIEDNIKNDNINALRKNDIEQFM